MLEKYPKLFYPQTNALKFHMTDKKTSKSSLPNVQTFEYMQLINSILD